MRVNAARRQASIQRNATFVEGHLDRTPPFLSMSRIGHRASESQESHMKRLIATNREQLSRTRIHVSALTNTGASQNKHATRRSD